MDRRRFLAATGTATLLGLTGCSDQGSTGTTTADGTSPEPSTTSPGGPRTTTEPPGTALNNG
ncbi:MAG: hypothetical protein V5A24_08575, partial [Haloarculaceae archaeon]